jgi:hypothetical protein
MEVGSLLELSVLIIQHGIIPQKTSIFMANNINVLEKQIISSGENL